MTKILDVDDGFSAATEPTNLGVDPSDIDFTEFILSEGSEPTTPAAGKVKLFVTDGDEGKLKLKDENGTVHKLEKVIEANATATISASGTLTLTDEPRQYFRVAGDSGNQSMSDTPFGSSPTNFVDGMEITVMGTDDTNYVTISTNDDQYGVVSPTGDAVLQEHFCVTYIYDATAERFIEKSRNH